MNQQAAYFGLHFKRYFSLLFEPASITSRCVVLICNPIGQENIRTNKAVIHLGRELAGQGIPAMTFDYFGMGDSSGRSEDMTSHSCLESITESAAYLKSQTGIDDVILLGIRMGGLFALGSDAVIRPKAVVLWHPVINGAAYVEESRREHRKWLLGSFVPKDGLFKKKTEMLGFLYSESFNEQISRMRVDLHAMNRTCLWLGNTDPKSMDSPAGENKHVTYLASAYRKFWTKSGLDDAIVPIHDIRCIVNWIKPLGVLTPTNR